MGFILIFIIGFCEILLFFFSRFFKNAIRFDIKPIIMHFIILLLNRYKVKRFNGKSFKIALFVRLKRKIGQL